MRPGETDYKGKFWVGQRVRILNLPSPNDVLCDTGIIKHISTKFERTPDLQANSYTVRIDGWGGIFKKKVFSRVREYATNGENLEPITNSPKPQENK